MSHFYLNKYIPKKNPLSSFKLLNFIAFLIKIETKMSIIKLSQLETILNYALQFILQTKSNKFYRKWRKNYQSSSHIWDRKSFDI